MKLFFYLISLPLLYWSQGVETAPQLKAAGIEQIAVAPENVEAWRNAGMKVVAMPKNELEGRERLLIPGVARRVNVASPTQAPWVDANGWRLLRKSGGQYLYDLPTGRAAIATAETFVYNADAVVKIDPADLAAFGKMLAFLRTLPADEMPTVADMALIEDGTTTTGEVMNLLTRRNLLFRLEAQPSTRYALNVKIGTREYPLDEAADPSSLARKIRRQIGDENRSLRIYGSEVVIARMFSDSTKTRLHLLNYGGRELEGLRIRVRGKFAKGEANVFGLGRTALEDFLVADGGVEFTIPKMSLFAMVELPVSK
ncbi:MAG: hypothetical protein JST84_08100 [Acidobacteria bacterium]|nr:hypothetical protein [Acidobacteriota bacterium]